MHRKRHDQDLLFYIYKAWPTRHLVATLMKKYYILYTRIYIFTYYMIESCVLYNGSIRSSKISLKAKHRAVSARYMYTTGHPICIFTQKTNYLSFYAYKYLSILLSLSRLSHHSRAHLLCLQFVLHTPTSSISFRKTLR